MLRKNLADDVFNFIKMQAPSSFAEGFCNSAGLMDSIHAVIFLNQTTQYCCKKAQAAILQQKAQNALLLAHSKCEFTS